MGPRWKPRKESVRCPPGHPLRLEVPESSEVLPLLIIVWERSKVKPREE